MKLSKILKHCRVVKPGRFRLADCDPAKSFGLDIDEDDVKGMLADGIARLARPRGAVAEAIIAALEGLKSEFPKVQGKALDELKKVERALRAEKPD